MHVLVAGAGVAGPVVAYWLNRYGFRGTVVERAPGVREAARADRPAEADGRGVAPVTSRSCATTSPSFCTERAATTWSTSSTSAARWPAPGGRPTLHDTVVVEDHPAVVERGG
jgi:cation diffusion facilitator CzcD-associated flavoprotein CzcO